MADIYYKSCNIHKLKIIKEDLNGNEISSMGVLGEDVQEAQLAVGSPSQFGGMSISESLLSPSMTGNLIILGVGDIIDNFNFTGNEKIELDFESAVEDVQARKTATFYVYEFVELQSPTTTTRTSGGQQLRYYQLKFSSKQAVKYYESEIPFAGDTEFMGKIAGNDADGSPGLIDYLAGKYFSDEPFEIEDTQNSIWIRGNNLSLPQRKPVISMALMELINYAASFSVRKENPNACLYFFWQDFDGWHYKSHEALLGEEAEQLSTGKNSYSVSSNELDPFRIKKLVDDSGMSFTRNMSDRSAFLGRYTIVKPNYFDPYARFLFDDEKYLYKTYEYNYQEDKEKWKKLESYHLIPDDFELVQTEAHKNYDDIWGWSDKGKYNENSDMEYIRGLTSEYPNELWQNYLDMSELNIETLKKIKREIKAPVSQALDEYRRKRDLKEKWNIYKYSVCCIADDQDELKSVLITDYYPIAKNIFRYEWKEIELIPKIELLNFMGLTADPIFAVTDDDEILDWYGASVGTINNITVPGLENVNTGEDLILKDLHGIANIRGSDDSVFDSIPSNLRAAIFGNLTIEEMRGKFTEGFTLDFYNDVYSPFLVLKKNYGGRGYTYDYTGAYNLNEVMNRSLFNFAEEDGLPDIPDNPPYEKEADTLVGPGVNTNKDSTDYPRGYTPNPIGSYHITSTGDYCPQTSIGQVVNLSVIDQTDLTLFGLKLTQGYTGDKKKIYYFSAENAHDGLCEGDCNNGY